MNGPKKISQYISISQNVVQYLNISISQYHQWKWVQNETPFLGPLVPQVPLHQRLPFVFPRFAAPRVAQLTRPSHLPGTQAPLMLDAVVKNTGHKPLRSFSLRWELYCVSC